MIKFNTNIIFKLFAAVCLIWILAPGCSGSGSGSGNQGGNNPPPTYQCSDGLDNDNDGLIDILDSGCKFDTDNDESAHPAENKPPVITDIEFYSAKEGDFFSAGSVGGDPEGKPVKFYKVSCTLDDPKYGGIVVMVGEDGTIRTMDPLPYNSEGVHTIKIGARDPAGNTGEYEERFNVDHVLGPNDLPYEFDVILSSEPADVTVGIDKVGWENRYAGNADVRNLFDNDPNNDMDLTMSRITDGNSLNWEFDNDPVIGYANIISLSTDTIYYRIRNPGTSNVEWRGENIGTAGVNLIKSK